MRPRVSLAVDALAALLVLVVALAGTPGRAHEGPRFMLVDASSGVSLSNSKTGQAIFHGEHLRPGDETSGSLTIANRGDAPAAYAVQATLEDEAAGGGGGRLWSALWVVVSDVSVPNDPVALYRGALADMRIAFGALSPGQERTYQFVVSLPRSTEAADAYQGGRLSLALDWTAEAVGVPETGGASASPVPQSALPPLSVAVPSAPPAPVAPAARPSPVPAAPDIVSPPSTRTCLSRRRFPIRVRPPRGLTVLRTTAYVDGRRAGSRRGPHALVSLRGLPRGPVRVTVRALLSNGRTLVRRRTYRTCTSRRVTHRRPAGRRR